MQRDTQMQADTGWDIYGELGNQERGREREREGERERERKREIGLSKVM